MYFRYIPYINNNINLSCNSKLHSSILTNYIYTHVHTCWYVRTSGLNPMTEEYATEVGTVARATTRPAKISLFNSPFSPLRIKVAKEAEKEAEKEVEKEVEIEVVRKMLREELRGVVRR